MHTRSAKNKITGKFTVVCIDWNGVECFRGDFDDVREADRAGEQAERQMTLRMQMPATAPLTLEEIMMSDDDLLAALEA